MPIAYRILAASLALALPVASTASAQSPTPVDPRLYAGLTWRNLGPFRAGRIAAVSGAIGQPGVFYVGLPAAGVWKTTSAGRTWFPVFDGVKEVSSIGAIEVAPSDPDVIYAGTGDIVTGGAINEGNGVYKSTDAGRSWRHLGLDATKQIPSMLVDPHDPNTVLVAAQGDIHVKSKSRGIFRSTDGGTTWTQALFVDDSTGVQKLARATDVPSVIFATTVLHYTPPPPSGTVQAGGFAAGGGANGPTATMLFKSTDAGVTWHAVSGGGLPRLNGKASVAVAMNTNAQRVFLVTNTGLYRSDDGGAAWRQVAADDQRIHNGQGGYNCGVYVDPQNPDVVYVINTSSYKSTDGGTTFTGFKGAPGGDDPQQMWIDPTNGKRILLGLDQGAVVSLDGGDTWSSWYNQSTDQIYHLSVDNSFPSWVYGTQQDAGAIRTRMRGNLGAITPLDWNPVSGWEWGTIVPDPLDPNIVYASGSGILRISYPTEEWINVSPAADPSRQLRTAFSQPMIFAPWNRHMLIAGFQAVWATTDGGAHWTAMSPDLGVRPDARPSPTAAGRPNTPPGGAIESMSGSTVAPGMLWVGTNNGLIKFTRDGGKTWHDASIPGIPNAARAEVLAVDASHFDASTAYAVLDLHRIGDYTPYVYRTRDFGKTWTRIVSGLATNQPSGSFARVIRNDTRKKGLLFAGTESGMYVSFDDGDHWQSLMQNLPTTSYRDIAIKNDHLVVATYGRGFWVIDDYSMLRQVTPAIANDASHLFKPGDAVRVRRNVGADTPFPPEVPHALNPSAGVAIDYWLAHAPSRDVTIDVMDSTGAVVRHLSSAPLAPVAEAARPPHPNFWIATPAPLAADAGTNRTHWDLRYDAPPAFSHSFEINANPGLTPTSPEGPLAIAGAYTIKLTANGQSSTQPVMVRNDPRAPASAAAIRAQHALQMKIYDGIKASYAGHAMALALQASLRDALPAGGSSELAEVTSKAVALAAQLDTVAGPEGGRGRGGGGGGRGRGQAVPPNFRAINGTLVRQLNAQDQGDLAPTAATLAGFMATCKELRAVATTWERLGGTELASVNALLKTKGRPAIAAPGEPLRVPACS
jgi:photosystem II stability/assembly factor-like uncharacterized protein